MNNNVTKSPREKIESVVAGMAITENFWGYLFGRVKKIESTNLPSIMGVAPEKNGSISLHIRPDLVKNTDEKTLELILEHEGLHLLNLHIPRLMRLLAMEIDDEVKQKKSMIWNIATDCAVNTQMNMPKTIKVSGMDWTLDFPNNYQLPNDRSSESYFYTLLKKNDNQCVNCGASKHEQEQQKGDSNNSENENEQSGENQEGKGSGQVQVKSKCPCCGKEHSKSYNIDDHGQWDQNGGESNNPEDVARKVEDQIKDLVRKSVKSFDASNRNRGNMPGYLKELIEELLDIPKIPYYQLIRSLVRGTRLTKWRKSYTRVNKKRVYTFFNNDQEYINPIISPFPGRQRDYSFNIVILIDTSGSQSTEDIAEALSGIKDIIENDKHCKVTVIEIDTTIGKEYNIKKVSDIDFEITGRGGTILKEGIVRSKELNPDVMLGFTDGYCDNINEFPDTILPKKIIWCISKGGTSKSLNQTGPVVFIDEEHN
ncbi:MAG: VWA-like domain-containing protein [Candidatus Izimaplasma sp.]|nr:VWA-like domain-containing protein [Candidatus Izimaplasma bacterium]